MLCLLNVAPIPLDIAPRTFIRAVKKDDLNRVKALTIYQSPDVIKRGLDIALKNDQFQIVKFFIIEKGIMPKSKDLSFAIKKEKLQMIKLLVENGKITVTAENLAAANQRKNLLIIQYLKEKYQASLVSVEPEIEVAPSDPPHTFDVPFSFIEAMEKAILHGYSYDQAEEWAIKNHDPVKDEYTLLQTWMEIEDPMAKEEMKKRLMMNPTYKTLFESEGGLDLTPNNFISAVEEGRLDIFTNWIETGVKPDQSYLFYATENGSLKVVKYLIEELKIIPTGYDLDFAIGYGNERLDIIQLLIEVYVNDLNSKEISTDLSAQKKELYLKLLNHGLLDNMSDSLILKIKSGLSQFDLNYLEAEENLQCKICMDKKISCYISCSRDGKFNHGICQECLNRIKRTTNRCPWCRTSLNDSKIYLNKIHK